MIDDYQSPDEGPGENNQAGGEGGANVEDIGEEITIFGDAIGLPVQLLDRAHFSGNDFTVETENQIYMFRLLPGETKTFRHPFYEGASGILLRNFVVNVQEAVNIVVSNPGDEWRLTYPGLEGGHAIVLAIASDLYQHNNPIVFNHVIPLVLPNLFIANLLCKPGCRYFCRAIDPENAEDQILINDHLPIPNEAVVQNVAEEHRAVLLDLNTTCDIRIGGDVNRHGDLACASVRVALLEVAAQLMAKQ